MFRVDKFDCNFRIIKSLQFFLVTRVLRQLGFFFRNPSPTDENEERRYMRRIAFYGFWNKTMWRAFFFAIGATLIISGLQCLVVDHVVVANGTRVPGFVAKYLDGGKRKINGQQPQLGGPNLIAGQNINSVGQPGINLQGPFQGPQGSVPTNPQASQPGLLSGIGSRFGPSRFADSQFSNTDLPGNISYYGGVPFSNRQPGAVQQFANQQQQGSQFSLAGYGGQLSGQAGVRTGRTGRLSPVTLGNGGSRPFKPSEWMPWGLLAVGTLVVLYTNSTGRGYSKD